jgi:hypothetical protein
VASRRGELVAASGGKDSAAFLTEANFARYVQGLNRGASGLGNAGSFISGPVQPIIDAHKEMAESAAKAVIKALKESIARTERVQRGTDYLIKALEDPEGYVATRDGFVIGGDFLEHSAAKAYFRNLEVGTRIFVGRELRGGFLSGEGGSFSGPDSSRIGLDPRLPQTGSFFALTKEAKATSAGRAADLASGKRKGFPQQFGESATRLPLAGGPRGFRIVIRNPIQPHEYFLNGRIEWLKSGEKERIYKKLLGDIPGLTFGS